VKEEVFFILNCHFLILNWCVVLSADLLIHAYRQSVFPMGLENGEIAWFSPDPRAILPLDAFHLPHGLRRVLKRIPFEIRINTEFEKVMRQCAARSETWITEELVVSYCNLHRLGYAHAVETWLDGALVGGLYGVAVGGAFFGESMFHSVTDASKVALHALVVRLRERGYSLLDPQWLTPHLQLFGAIEISRKLYRDLLANCIDDPRSFVDPAPDSKCAI
jgi:leucyl/phenylalanyl-tRNA--protein transferase